MFLCSKRMAQTSSYLRPILFFSYEREAVTAFCNVSQNFRCVSLICFISVTALNFRRRKNIKKTMARILAKKGEKQSCKGREKQAVVVLKTR